MKQWVVSSCGQELFVYMVTGTGRLPCFLYRFYGNAGCAAARVVQPSRREVRCVGVM